MSIVTLILKRVMLWLIGDVILIDLSENIKINGEINPNRSDLIVSVFGFNSSQNNQFQQK